MITVFNDSVHESSLKREGAAFNAPCAKCRHALKDYCSHEIGISTIDRQNELQILRKLTRESMGLDNPNPLV